MKCRHCTAENLADALFCDACGKGIETTCASCGTTNRPTARFCRQCGVEMRADARPLAPEPTTYTPRHLAEKILTSRAVLEGERKQVTVMFADVKGSMDL